MYKWHIIQNYWERAVHAAAQMFNNKGLVKFVSIISKRYQFCFQKSIIVYV